jgi:gamma-glutamylcyclotransferase (GGCT)/AIG2-like uncharacterized protein YtfP
VTNPMTHRVFVYGTLKSGIHNHRLLAHAKFIGYAITDQAYHMVAGGFPIVLEGGDYAVKGEVYEVDDATLRYLDYLEGYRDEDNPANMYDRRSIVVQVWTGAALENQRASIYIGNNKRGVGDSWPEWTVTNSTGQLEWPKSTT